MMDKEKELHDNIMAQVVDTYPLPPNLTEEQRNKINEDRSALYDTLYDKLDK